MTILIFGVSNVGKTTAGGLLSDKIGFDFYDLDLEVKKFFGITLEEFVKKGTLRYRDSVRCDIVEKLAALPGNKVIAVAPLSHAGKLNGLLLQDDVVTIELLDTPENIFDRMVFSDENDVIYKDDEYKNKHKAYYLEDIRDDLRWYGSVYAGIENKIHVNNDSPDVVVERIIELLNLERKN